MVPKKFSAAVSYQQDEEHVQEGQIFQLHLPHSFSCYICAKVSDEVPYQRDDNQMQEGQSNFNCACLPAML